MGTYSLDLENNDNFHGFQGFFKNIYYQFVAVVRDTNWSTGQRRGW